MIRHIRATAIVPAVTLLAFSTLAATRASAAVATVGGLGSATEFSATNSTFIDLARSASATGTYSSATIYWAGGSSSCSGSFMLKFYRKDGTTNLNFVDERGPFSAPGGLVDVTLSPPVSLIAGDVVGITELGGEDCGAVEMITGAGNQTLQFDGDSGTASISLCDQQDSHLLSQTIGVLVRGTGSLNRAGIVLGAGSVQGAAGSNFKTSMQLVNPGGETIQGQLIFRLAVHGAPAGDAGTSYSIAAGQSINFPDIGSALETSGLGSIDVLASSSYAPLVVTRIFNDGGAAGTAGFSEPMVRPGDEFIIEAPRTAFLVAPSDFTKSRMNIAVRALSEGATLEFRVTHSNGTFVGFGTKTYGADEFDLDSTTTLLPGVTIGNNDTIQVKVTAGRAIVGGVSVDNTTNDTSLQLGTRTHF